ncbi:unnamed protein product [Prorocentrum cordatum]|uniref:Uncharacterized protein n=1 Tax=Prorocentrum cordatum TaxID=2364126 RepID=A0ABN9X7P5_9DINO|nr:unnamed protein product [Polarella glacialis]
MGQRVLDATLSAPEENTLALRVYAHCTSRSAPSDGASNGAVTVLVINLGNESTTVSFPSSVGVISREYVLTPTSTKDSSLINATGLLGTGVALNGKLLKLNADGSVPEIVGNLVGRHASVVPATAIAFFVLADAGHAACLAQPSTPTEDAAIPI